MDNFTIDASKFLRGLNRYDKKTSAAAVKAMDENRMRLEQQAVELAPFRKGWLINRRTSTKPRWRGHVLESSVGFNTPYAATTHELMWPATPVSFGRSGAEGAGMMPGKETRKKPGNEWGPAGGKYLERPLFGNARRFMANIANALRRLK